MPSVAASLVALALIVAPNARGADCASAGDRYTAVFAKLIEALRAFEACVASSGKRDDCMNEFEVLDSAHDDFADAVDDQKECG